MTGYIGGMPAVAPNNIGVEDVRLEKRSLEDLVLKTLFILQAMPEGQVAKIRWTGSVMRVWLITSSSMKDKIRKLPVEVEGVPLRYFDAATLASRRSD